ncbi:DUF6438 domain-containing protein [Flavobacterium sp. RHBU_24]|uniref:DUF6438 domain-containing protein n=1 Tax=Flavobacterium sp. RHBU_24 TaxID=3391185 RepID=UPI0039855CFD
MPKSIIVIFVSLLLLISCNKQDEFVKAKLIPTRIDSLKTTAEIEKYIGNTDSLYRKFTLLKVQDIFCGSCDTLLDKLADSLHIDFSWQKADLDNNGYTDLLVTGTNKTYGSWNYDPKMEAEYSKEFNAFVLMNFGNSGIKTYDLTDGHYLTLVARIEYNGRQPFIAVYTPKVISVVDLHRREKTKSKLTFKFNDFIEYNPKPDTYDIEKVEYITTGCMGMCPVFSLNIGKDGNAAFVARDYNYTLPWQKGVLLNGTYKTKIKDKDLKELIDILEYTDFPNLKNDYHVPWTCDDTGAIKITYNGGKTKTIVDYGAQGTYGLRKLHSVFHQLRLNREWKFVSKETPYNYDIFKGK